ncbi:MAG: tetratricopeptide (TPR) repeat protein [Saprospiraceae bacterium]|jgi:tetratricopeptide (TPR) repeat protein
MNKKILLLPFLLLLQISVFAGGYFKWTPNAQATYKKIIDLRLDEAEVNINALKQSEPDNLIILHLENYVDFFKVFIHEDKAEFERLEANKDRRLELIKEGDESSPYYLYLQADIRLQWALAHLKFEEYATAFFETNKAFKLLTENSKKYPNFKANKKDLGILHAMVGTIPDNYKWLVESLTSMEGTIDQGQQELKSVVSFARNNDFIYETETYVFYAYLMLHLGNNEKVAWELINESNLRPTESPLSAFIMANVAMRTDRNDEGIRILQNRPKGPEYTTFPYLDYMLGSAKLNRLDVDADLYLKKYLQEFNGLNFIKDSYRRLAWYELIKGNKSGYTSYMREVKSKGNTIVGGDESALKEAEKGDTPDVDLLKARVLFDGGYYNKAYALLVKKQVSNYNGSHYILEYNYRMGRILHKMKKYSEAVSYYDKTIKRGRHEVWYFACRAALEKGRIYEAQGKNVEARTAYKDCISIKPGEHKTGLHQGAKAGLSRTK